MAPNSALEMWNSHKAVVSKHQRKRHEQMILCLALDDM
jgi:hypothetical protein